MSRNFRRVFASLGIIGLGFVDLQFSDSTFTGIRVHNRFMYLRLLDFLV